MQILLLVEDTQNVCLYLGVKFMGNAELLRLLLFFFLLSVLILNKGILTQI